MKPLLFPRQRYACVQCGKSCGDWRIWVEEGLLPQLSRHPLVLELEVRQQAWLGRDPEGQAHLLHQADGRCHFLQADRLCGLHAQSGWEAKPRACRQFPFFLVETPEGIQVGLSFRCTAVLEDHGVEWQEHQQALESLVSTGHYPRVGFSPAQLGRFRLEWSTYLEWESQWQRALEAGNGLSRAVYGRLQPALGMDLSLEGWLQLLRRFSLQALSFLEAHNSRLDGALSGEARPDGLKVRYLSHVLERKSLWCGDWLGRLLLLLVGEHLLEMYAAQLGWPEAVQIIEGELLAHRPDLEDIEVGLAATLLSFCQPSDSGAQA